MLSYATVDDATVLRGTSRGVSELSNAQSMRCIALLVVKINSHQMLDDEICRAISYDFLVYDHFGV